MSADSQIGDVSCNAGVEVTSSGGVIAREEDALQLLLSRLVELESDGGIMGGNSGSGIETSFGNDVPKPVRADCS